MKMDLKRLQVALFASIGWLMGCSSALGQTTTSPLNLQWDDGATDVGTAAVSQPSVAAGSYYFRINTRSVEAWRTRLRVTSGEANLYLLRGAIPVVGQAGVRASAHSRQLKQEIAISRNARRVLRSDFTCLGSGL